MRRSEAQLGRPALPASNAVRLLIGLACLLVLGSIACAADNRQIVNDTTKGPAQYVCYVQGGVNLEEPKGFFCNNPGSGVLIGPRHVLTAAHVIVNKKDGEVWPVIWVTPGMDAGHRPFGYYEVAGIRMQRTYHAAEKYVANREAEGLLTDHDTRLATTFDFAVLVLSRPVDGIPGPFMQPRYLTDAQITAIGGGLNLNGYDGDQPFAKQVTRTLTLQPMRYVFEGFFLPGSILPKKTQLTVYEAPQAYVWQGASGGPIWFAQPSAGGSPTYQVIGVHSKGKHGKKPGEPGGGGVLFDEEYIKWLNWAVQERP